MSRTYRKSSIYNKGWNNEDDAFKAMKKSFKRSESKKVRRAARVEIVAIDHSAEIAALRGKAQYLREEAERLRQEAARLTTLADALCKQNTKGELLVENVVIRKNLDWFIF